MYARLKEDVRPRVQAGDRTAAGIAAPEMHRFYRTARRQDARRAIDAPHVRRDELYWNERLGVYNE